MHVAHRLDRYGAGRRMDFDTADPDTIATAIAEEIGPTSAVVTGLCPGYHRV